MVNCFGVLNWIIGLFIKRYYNIESIIVGYIEIIGVFRIIFVVYVEGENDVE